MKPNTVLIYVALLAYWAGLCNASAFYDPGAQRWLNRDPIGELGFEASPSRKGSVHEREQNLYTFVGNDNVDFYDIYGLQSVCDNIGTQFDDCMKCVPSWAYNKISDALKSFQKCLHDVGQNPRGKGPRGIGVVLKIGEYGLCAAKLAALEAFYGSLGLGASMGCLAQAAGTYYQCVVIENGSEPPAPVP